MRLRYAFLAAAILIMSVFSALGLNGVWDPEASFYGQSGDHSGNLGGDQQLMPSDTSPASMDWTDTDPSSWADLLMLHPQTLPSPGSDGFEPMGTNEFVQVNYDGFQAGVGGNRYRCQTFAIQQFTRNLEGGGTKTELYVGVEAGEQVGEDYINWSQVWRSGYPPVRDSWVQVAEDGFGDSDNEHIDSAVVFKDKLYMGVCNETTGCQVWRTDGSEETGKSPYLNWTKVADGGFGSNNGNAYCMALFNGYLYVGTFNGYSGCEVWRSSDPAVGNWTWVNYGGFGSSEAAYERANICVMDMIVFDAKDGEGPRLYAGTWNYDGTEPTGGRIFRYAEDSGIQKWDKVWDGVVNPDHSPKKYALAARCFAEFENELYVGIFHNVENEVGLGLDVFKSADGSTWSGVSYIGGAMASDVIDLINFYDTNEDPPANHLYATTGQGTLDLVWRSSNGTSWSKRSDDGFGDENNYSLFCFGTFGKRHGFNALYVGTWNDHEDDVKENGTGTQIWQTPTTESKCTYITLDSFDATAQKDGSILLRWVTGTEIGTAGFDLYRSVSPDFSSFEKVTPRMIEARGTPQAGAEYKVLDKSVNPGTLYYYFLVEIDVNGKMSAFGPIQSRARIPTPEKFEMYSAIIQMDTFGV